MRFGYEVERFSSGEEKEGGCRAWQERQYERRETARGKAIKHVAKLVFQANPNRKCKRGIKKKAI